MPEMIPPFLLFFLGAALLPALPKALRGWVFLVPPVVALWVISGLQEGQSITADFLIWELEPMRVDRLSLLFAWIFAMVTFVAGVYALHVKDLGQQVSALLYAGAALGAVFAGDLFTLFVFWEVMAVTSTYLVLARRTDEARASAMRYLYVHLLGGAMLLGGILLHWSGTGSLAFNAFQDPTPASWLILLGFALNAAIPPLHAWIADAYPTATVTGAVFMSAFTTKTAVYTLARGFAGWEILVIAGVMMTLYGVVYAVLANDIRRVLAYHIVSQVGFMVVGVGLGSELAINGATAHAFTHILYKGLLFMGGGAVLYQVGTSRLSELGGLGKYMPWVVVFYMVGAFSISGFPLWSGFVSKPITVSAAEYLNRDVVVVLMHLASIGTFLSIALKVPYLAWAGEAKRSYELKPLPWNMMAAMAIGAILNTWMGISPGWLYSILPYDFTYQPYYWAHLTKSFQLLGFSFLAYWLVRDKLKAAAKLMLDTDWVYRRPARISYHLGPRVVAGAFGAVERGVGHVVSAVVRVGRDPVGWLRPLEAKQALAGGAESGSTSFRITMTAGVILVLVTLLAIFGAVLLL